VVEQDVPLGGAKGIVSGYCAPSYAALRDVFIHNFVDREELGASLCIIVRGEVVVDLWGGLKSPDGQAWTRDTVSATYSCTKGATALCAHLLADHGVLDLEAPIARYWPEFAANGKAKATVAMALDHSLGLPHLRATVKPGGYYDYDYMVDLLAREAPFWEPGTRSGYHGHSFGWIVGEIVRRASGKRLSDLFRDEIAVPLSLDFSIGCDSATAARVAPIIRPQPNMGSRFIQAIQSDPPLPARYMMTNTGQYDVNSAEFLAAELGALNGITNARGLAGLYDGLLRGEIISRDGVARMGRTSSATRHDATLLVPSRFSLGFMKSMDNSAIGDGSEASLVLSEPAFGHAGAGGSLGFVDPGPELAFGYTMNRLGGDVLMNPRGQDLVDATYRALGYTSRASGAWIV
jgi:CubicO group peptidase (beta-lactamase class C family)